MYSAIVGRLWKYFKRQTAAIVTVAPSSSDGSQDGLGRLIDEKSRDAFCTEIWTGIESADQLRPLVRHYQRCCNAANVSGLPVAERPDSDVVAAVAAIRDNKTRDEVLACITDGIHAWHHDSSCVVEDAEVAEQIVAIAFMITLMCNVQIGRAKAMGTKPSARHLAWVPGGGDVSSLLSDAFPASNKLQAAGRLPKTFHARNLERLGSIEVEWTSNLLDHLRLHDPPEEGKPFTVSVFHYAQFLQAYQANQASKLFPTNLIEETERTLALLFPGYVGGTEGWFKQQQTYNKDLDISACFCNFSDDENRTIESFNYWRDRIAILKQAYDEAEPKTVWQWWNDGRKMERWATFWVALIVLALTIFFGVVQCLEGALQVYKAYKPTP